MDLYYEQLIKFKKKTAVLVSQIIIWVCAVLIITLCFIGMLNIPFLVIIFAGIGYGVGYMAYKMTMSFEFEYEYIFTNGEIDIDKIIAMRTRKRLLTFECKDVEKIGNYSDDAVKNLLVDKKIFANSSDNGMIYVIVKTNSKGRVLLVFSPDEKLLENMKRFVPASVYKDGFGRY